MKIAYLLFVRVVSLMKNLYRKRHQDNSTNAIILAALFMTFNLVTLTAYLIHALGLTNPKYNPSFSTRGVKVLISMFILLGILALFERTNSKMPFSKKRNHFKRIISTTPNVYFTIGYLILSISFSLFVLIKFFL